MCLFIIPHVRPYRAPRMSRQCGGPCPILPAATQDPGWEASADVVDTGSLEGGCPAKGRQPQPHGTGLWTHKSEISSDWLG